MRCPICNLEHDFGDSLESLAVHVDCYHCDARDTLSWNKNYHCACGLSWPTGGGRNSLTLHLASFGDQLAEHLNYHAVRQALAKL